MLFTEKFYVFVSAKLQSTSISEDIICPLLSHQMFPDNAHPWLTITTHPDGSLFRGHILKWDFLHLFQHKALYYITELRNNCVRGTPKLQIQHSEGSDGQELNAGGIPPSLIPFCIFVEGLCCPSFGSATSDWSICRGLLQPKICEYAQSPFLHTMNRKSPWWNKWSRKFSHPKSRLLLFPSRSYCYALK